MEVNIQIREAAHRRLAQKEWTQNELAKHAGVRQATVSRLLSGDRGKANALLSVLAALDLELVAVPKGTDIEKLFESQEKGDSNG